MRRMSGASVRPCTTSVMPMTQIVRKMITSRPGNAAPVSVVSGIDSATASEIAPRMPAQPTTRRSFGPIGSRPPSRSSSGEHGEVVDEPHRHDDEREDDAGEDQLARRLVEVVEHRRELQPDQDEQQRLEEEREDLPEAVRLQARRRVGDLRVARAEVEPAHHRGEDARDVQLLRPDVEQVRRQERDGDLDERVVQAPAQLADQPSRPRGR